jgi:hypothetical protein
MLLGLLFGVGSGEMFGGGRRDGSTNKATKRHVRSNPQEPHIYAKPQAGQFHTGNIPTCACATYLSSTPQDGISSTMYQCDITVFEEVFPFEVDYNPYNGEIVGQIIRCRGQLEKELFFDKLLGLLNIGRGRLGRIGGQKCLG